MFVGYAPPPPDIRQEPAPAISEAEFEEIMSRNRTVSSSAIARAVSDAAAGMLNVFQVTVNYFTVAFQ